MKKLLISFIGIAFISAISFNMAIALGGNQVAPAEEGFNYYWKVFPCPDDHDFTFESCEADGGTTIKCTTPGSTRNNNCPPPTEPDY